MKESCTKMTLKEYMKLPYNFMVTYMEDETGYYLGKILELGGCQSKGDTLEEVYSNLKREQEKWIRGKIESNSAIPMPLTENSYSGKFNVRIPKSLHQKLSVEAEKEGVSLNQYIVYKLSL
mgnify:CR=1 FL=1